MLTVSVSYAHSHFSELMRHIHDGGLVRIMDLRTRSVSGWLVPTLGVQAGVDDLHLIDSRQRRVFSEAARARESVSGNLRRKETASA